jgi:hypothetical protein
VFAADTKVPAEKTRAEIETILVKHGAKQYAVAVDRDRNQAHIEFKINRRRVRFELQLPPPQNAQQVRSRWRALLLCIKAKLETVELGIATFDEEFLSNIVMPDGRRFGEITIPQLEYVEKSSN